MSLSHDDEDTVVVQHIERDGPDPVPPASSYIDEADGQQYLFVVEDDSCDVWIACTESVNLNDWH